MNILKSMVSITSAKNRKDFISKFQALSTPVSRHLVKILTIADEKAQEQWVSETNAWLNELSELVCKVPVPASVLASALNDYDEGEEWRVVKTYCASSDNKSNSALVYDDYKLALKKVKDILLEYAKGRDTFYDLRRLSAFKTAIENRGSKTHPVTIEDIVKNKSL